MTTAHIEQVTSGVHLWRATHPEWNTTVERVACYALDFGADGVLLVDGLIGTGDEADELLSELKALVGKRPVHHYVTIPYHVRDSERLAQALGGRIYGDSRVEKRLQDTALAADAREPGALPFGIEAIDIGNPRRAEVPLYSPTHRALIVGDLAIGTPNGPRLWQGVEGKEEWYRDRFLPSLQHLLELQIDHLLVTHGTPVIGTGKRALEEMLTSPPVASISGQLAGDAVPAVAGRV